MEVDSNTGGRPFTPVIVAAVIGLILAVSLRVPLIGLPVEAPLLGVSIKSASAVVALLLAYLAFGRARVTGLLRDLALVYALTLIALASIFLSTLPAILAMSPDRTPVPASAIAVAAALLAYASTDSERVATPGGRAWLDLAAVFVTSSAVLTAVLLLGGGAEHSPQLVPVLEVAAAIGFLAAATGFARRAVDDTAPLLRWLAIAATLAGVARIDYALFSPANLAWISPGDVIHLGFYLALAVGAVKEIGVHWRDTARIAVLEERRRIGRDLHDGLAQELAYIALEADALGVDNDDSRLRGLAAAAQRALGESRRAIASFSAPADETLGEALTHTAEDVAHRFGIPLVLDLSPGIELPARAREDLLRIVREAVTNAGRHARAGQIHLELTNSHGVTLTVRDDGRGFDRRDTEVTNGGFGLRSMEERATAMGGELKVWSAWGAGTEVTVSLP